MMDPQQANELSVKANEVQETARDVMALHSELSSKSDENVSNQTLFIAQYNKTHENVLVGDLIAALKFNKFDTSWINHKPEQILDLPVFVSLIICSEKQGKQND